MQRLLLFLLLPLTVLAVDYDPRTYGAVVDDAELDTQALQAAIDAAAQAGGGRVVLSEGKFRAGALFLKPGVELHVAKGSQLIGSNRLEDYPTVPTRVEGQALEWRAALLNGEGLRGQVLSGEGRIDGNGILFWASFWQRRKENPKCTNLEVERPRLIFFRDSQAIRLSGLTLADSGFWTVHLYRCSDVLLEGLSIQSPMTVPIRAPSTDGIDIDSCQNVTVRKCFISVDDDCIALKGTKGPFALEDKASPPTENILIEDCTFGHGHGVLTCGSEATVVRNVIVRRCTVEGKNALVRLKLRPDTPQHYENLLFEDITMKEAHEIFDVRRWAQFFDPKGQPTPPSSVKGVTVRRIKGSVLRLGALRGHDQTTFADVTWEDCVLTTKETTWERRPDIVVQHRGLEVNGVAFTP